VRGAEIPGPFTSFWAKVWRTLASLGRTKNPPSEKPEGAKPPVTETKSNPVLDPSIVNYKIRVKNIKKLLKQANNALNAQPSIPKAFKQAAGDFTDYWESYSRDREIGSMRPDQKMRLLMGDQPMARIITDQFQGDIESLVLLTKVIEQNMEQLPDGAVKSAWQEVMKEWKSHAAEEYNWYMREADKLRKDIKDHPQKEHGQRDLRNDQRADYNAAMVALYKLLP
jgi:hypothetical protein